MTAFVALLRGVNVGGAHPLPMADLRHVFAEAGARRVATLLASGNVTFEAGAEESAAIVARAARSVRDRLGFEVPIIARDAANWRASLARNPFLAAGADPATLHLACLSRAPDAAAIARLDPGRSPPDAFAVIGADVYLQLPNGVARSKLTNAWLDKTLGVVSTLRNWRTAERIAQALGV